MSMNINNHFFFLQHFVYFETKDTSNQIEETTFNICPLHTSQLSRKNKMKTIERGRDLDGESVSISVCII